MITVKKNGLTKKVATGYSFKSLLFGVFYPAARGDFKGFAIQLALGLFTCGLSWIVVPFRYNKIYLERLISDGWEIKE
jgi:hypothetical protein